MKSSLLKRIITSIACVGVTLTVFSQDNTININGEDAGSWLKQHWMWVAGGLILLLLLIGMLSGNRSRSRRTVVREEDINGVVKTTITESND